ncbi:hypothetical protein J4402_04330 [Candidatus Pacearchaeota archaeon]|nr:hypothetical protein [Candidatus Pacearchaeota archaeon]
MKSLRNAGIAILVGLIFGAVSFVRVLIKIIPQLGNEQAINESISSLMSAPLVVVGLIISITVAILVLQGFLKLGKKFNNNLLIKVSWLIAILSIANSLISNIPLLNSNNPLDITGNTKFAIGFLVLYGILTLLLGVSLLKIKQKIKLAKPVGILNIIIGAAFITFILSPIGFLIYLVNLIITSVMFFKASKQFKE